MDSRPAESPLVETIWRSRSSQAGPFLSIAASRLELVVARHEGQLYCTVRGPETFPTMAHCPPDGEWLGIEFKHGVFLPHLRTGDLVNGEVKLPRASSRSFWLHGSAWEFPTFDNAEVFIARLIKEELLVHDPVVTSALQAQATDLSLRSVQRRFRRATGLTHGAISQIEQARLAVALLRQGVSILDTVALACYADHPHLTRSLKRLIGQTPVQLASESNPMQLSYYSTPELIRQNLRQE
ncbi:MAG: helix-turn-helix transcriptional regulator [Anaerolineae bacterium]|nr:helix-turn-helix transcriptional regulator [Anaerolineae bacterium]